MKAPMGKGGTRLKEAKKAKIAKAVCRSRAFCLFASIDLRPFPTGSVAGYGRRRLLDDDCYRIGVLIIGMQNHADIAAPDQSARQPEVDLIDPGESRRGPCKENLGEFAADARLNRGGGEAAQARGEHHEKN